MASEYRLQIVHRDNGLIVSWPPGLAAEKDLVDALCARVQTKGVGIGATEAHVIADVRAAFEEILVEIKREI